MHRKIKIILNPMADMGNAWRVARDLRSITEQHGGIDWSGTVYPGHAIDLAKSAEGYDMVIAMGGDGSSITIHCNRLSVVNAFGSNACAPHGRNTILARHNPQPDGYRCPAQAPSMGNMGGKNPRIL